MTGREPVDHLNAWSERGQEVPENLTDDNTDVQAPAQEAEQVDSADESQELDAPEQPTDEVDAAEDVSDEADAESDEDDDDDDVVDSADDEAWRKRLRRKNREAKKLRDRAVSAESELAKYKAAEQTGLPLELAARLQGSTPEELNADAEKLLELVGKKSFVPGAPPATGDRQGDFRVTPETETDLGKIGARIFER